MWKSLSALLLATALSTSPARAETIEEVSGLENRIELALGLNEGFSYDQYMVSTNVRSLFSLTNALYSELPQDHGSLRAFYLLLQILLFSPLVVTTHELGHHENYTDAGIEATLNIGVFEGEINPMGEIKTDIGKLIVPDCYCLIRAGQDGFIAIRDITDNEQGNTPRDLMAASGGGVAATTTLAGDILRSSLKERKLSIPQTIGYVMSHLGISYYVLRNNLNRSPFQDDQTSTMKEEMGDINYYIYELLMNSYFPFQSTDKRWDTITIEGTEQYFESIRPILGSPSRPGDTLIMPTGGRATAIHSYVLWKKEVVDWEKKGSQNVDPNLHGVAIANALDPYFLRSIYEVLVDHVAFGERTADFFPSWVPRVTGYFGVPRPMYGLEWNISHEDAIISPSVRFTVDEETAGSLRLDVTNLQLTYLPFDITADVGAEVISQEEGSPYFEEYTWGYAVQGKLNLYYDSFGFGVYLQAKSKEVWTPHQTGMKDNIKGGVILSLDLSKL